MASIQHLLVQIRLFTRLILSLPWYTTNSLFASTRARSTWTFKRAVMMQILRNVVGDSVRYGISDGGTHEKLKLGKGFMGTYVEPIPQLIKGKLATWAENANVQPILVPGYWMHRTGVDLAMGEKPAQGEKVLYYMHGGGYVSFSAHPSSLPAGLPKALLSEGGGARIMRSFSIEYRLCKPDYAPKSAPNHGPFPAALLDALAGYNYLVNKVGFNPQDVIFVGDSCGANLALALCRYLVEGKLDGLAPPGALILVCPWSDLSDSHALHGSYVANATTDMLTYAFDVSAERQSAAPHNFVVPKQLTLDPDFYLNPYISPACRKPGCESISFKGWPQALICAGGAEMLCDEIRELKDRMVRDMGETNVRYVEAPDAVHDYCGLPWHEPERSEFLEVTKKWFSAL
ncbi:alpha/beta-hydrolase [Schizopora paradoxa]|uniref:Alpha/beta-hydrolase n=1 Tax=Schizopora paradoxa TaxID=27342 RepID=A0A0H2RU36_9AGAM|nr:alpha/beta-hydrolase [Schizopora paradoxa]